MLSGVHGSLMWVFTVRRTKVKSRVETAYGEWVERIPAWIKWATQVRLQPPERAGCCHALLKCQLLPTCGKHSSVLGTDLLKLFPQEWNEIQFNGVYYEPPEAGAPGEVPTFETSYTFKYPRPKRPENLRIYEAHVGMSSEEPKVHPAI